MIDRLRLHRRALLRAALAGTTLLSLPLIDAPARATASVVPASVTTKITPTTRGRVGVSANSGILWETVASQNASLDFMKAIGVTGIRIDIPWRWVEPTRGNFTWTVVDRIVNAAAARDMSVLGVLTSTPQWAALGSSSNQQTRPAKTSDWTAFVRATAQRYAGRIFAYEIWNEPNSAQYFAPAPDPAAYAALVRAAVPAIRAADAEAHILAGALGPAPATGSGMIHAVEFFTAMLQAGVGDVDGYSYHPYDNDQTMSQAAFWDGSAIRQAMTMHEILRARDEGHKKIWATEYGAPASLGEARQGELVVTGIQQWGECSFTGPMYIHHHRDQGAGDTYGLASAALAPRSAAYGVQGIHSQNAHRQHEAVVFESAADPTLGAPLSPVYPLAGGFAQDHVSGSRFLGPVGWLSAPTDVATVLRHANRQPAGPFANGRQDVLIPEAGAQPAGRIFSSDAGAFLVVGSILEAWHEGIGFPIASAREENGGVVQDFANASLAWRPGVAVSPTWK